MLNPYFWKKKERQIIKKWYGKITAQEIQEKFLHNRTVKAIYWEAQKQKIRSYLQKKELRKRWKTDKNYRKLMKRTRAKINFSEEGRKKVIQKAKERWQNPEFKEKVLKASFKGRQIRPTKPEKFVIKIKRKHKLPYIYNGGRIGEIICGKKPDFVDFENKKIIEVFSDWHKPNSFVRTNSQDYYFPLLRKRLFAKEGYQTLIIWEKDIKRNPIQIENKIVKFFKK
jgi:hypothetical protein